jgi:DNA-binding CsgD family transcriptional regulator
MLTSIALASRQIRNVARTSSKAEVMARTPLVLVEASERERYREGLYFALDAHGAITHASSGAQDWLLPTRRAELAMFVASLDRDKARAGELILDGFKINVVALVSTSDKRAGCYYVTLMPAETPEPDEQALLTPRQWDIAQYAIAGATNAEIAKALGISPETVRSHIKQIYQKLEVCNRLELARRLQL